MVIAHTPKPLSNECPLCHTDTMVLAKLPDTNVVIACTSCGVCSEPFPSHPHAQGSWRHIRSYLRKKPTPDPELDSYTLYYGKFRTCAARFVKYDRPMTCDREALDYARDYMRNNGLFVVGVCKSLHPWGDHRDVAFVCDTSQIEVKCRASFDPWDTGYHPLPWAKHSMNRKGARSGVDVEQLAREMDYAYWLTNPYDYGDQFGFYPSEEGPQASFELLQTVEGVDSGIEFLECEADPNEIPGYDDLLARLKAWRKEMPVGSASRKPRLSGKSPGMRMLGRRRSA